MGKITREVEVEGGDYRDRMTGEKVTAICWQKDGDHPLVERYPIEKRDFKGLLVNGPKDKQALCYGDWVCEDEKKRLYVVSAAAFPRRYQDAAGWEKEQKSKAKADAAAKVVVVVLALAAAILGDSDALPFLAFGVTHLMYYSALLGQWNGLTNGVFDLDTDTVKVSAHTNTYAPNQDVHDFFDDATNEVTGTNYVAGGATLASVTLTRSTTTVTFDAADVVWAQSGSGFSTARKFVIYRSTGTAATSRLFSVVTADADVGNVTGDLTIAWNASGIATWSTT
jgi:hypothetical protein